jgi:hypothetical protein
MRNRKVPSTLAVLAFGRGDLVSVGTSRLRQDRYSLLCGHLLVLCGSGLKEIFLSLYEVPEQAVKAEAK